MTIIIILLLICAFVFAVLYNKASKRFSAKQINDFNQRYKKGFYNDRP